MALGCFEEIVSKRIFLSFIDNSCHELGLKLQGDDYKDHADLQDYVSTLDFALSYVFGKRSTFTTALEQIHILMMDDLVDRLLSYAVDKRVMTYDRGGNDIIFDITKGEMLDKGAKFFVQTLTDWGMNFQLDDPRDGTRLRVTVKLDRREVA